MLFPMKTDNRIIYSKQHLNIVVIVTSVPPSPDCPFDLFSNTVQHPWRIQFRLCKTKWLVTKKHLFLIIWQHQHVKHLKDICALALASCKFSFFSSSLQSASGCQPRTTESNPNKDSILTDINPGYKPMSFLNADAKTNISNILQFGRLWPTVWGLWGTFLSSYIPSWHTHSCVAQIPEE